MITRELSKLDFEVLDRALKKLSDDRSAEGRDRLRAETLRDLFQEAHSVEMYVDREER